MGCDIHLHIEIKIDGNWEHYAYPHIARSYVLFGVLAGVRGDSKPIVAPKGFPVDASVVTKLDYAHWGSDAHTPSWLNAKEVGRLRRWFDDETTTAVSLEYNILSNTYLFGNAFDVADLPSTVEDFRFVFWFDN